MGALHDYVVRIGVLVVHPLRGECLHDELESCCTTRYTTLHDLHDTENEEQQGPDVDENDAKCGAIGDIFQRLPDAKNRYNNL